MKIKQLDLSDIIESFSDLAPLELESLPSVDLLVCTSGFEKRTNEVVRRAQRCKWFNDVSVLAILYPTNESDNSVHWEELRRLTRSVVASFTISYSRLGYREELMKALGRVPRDGTVLFDISTCSSYLFYPTMRCLAEHDFRVIIAYAEAGDYYPSIAEWRAVAEEAEREGGLFIRSFEDAEFQSIGVEEVYPYAPFSEMNPGNRASSLIAVPNFNPARMNAVVNRDREINKTAFADILWVLGEPPAEENKWRVDALRKTNSLEHINASNLLMASTLYYKEVLKVLESIWQARKYTHQISVAPLGSKMQHLGIFIFLLLHPEVGLWLAEPAKFRASRFSEEVGSVWCVDLGSFARLRDVVGRYMTFEWSFR